MVVVRVWLHQIDNVEAIDLVFPSVVHFEVVPLSLTIIAVVVLKVEVVLEVAHFDCLAKISTFEATLEDEGLVLHLRLLQLVIWL